MLEHLLAIGGVGVAAAGWVMLRLWIGDLDGEPDADEGEGSCGACTLCEPDEADPAACDEPVASQSPGRAAR